MVPAVIDAHHIHELYAVFGPMKGLFTEKARDVVQSAALEEHSESEAERESDSESDASSEDLSELESCDPSEDSFDYVLDAEQ